VVNCNPTSAAYIFGWNDYSEYNQLKKLESEDGKVFEYTDSDGNKQEMTESDRQLWLGRYDLWNSKISSSRDHFYAAKEFWDKNQQLTSNDKPENRNLIRLTEILTRPFLGVSYNLHDIMVTQDILRYDEDGVLHNDLLKYDDKGNRLSGIKDVPEKKDEKTVNFTVLPVQLGPVQFDGSYNVSTIDYGGTIDSKFQFEPVVNQFTPKYLLDLKGNEYDLIRFGKLDTESVNANLALTMFDTLGDVLGDWNKAPSYINWARILSPIIVSKISLGYKLTHTGMGISAFPDYKYNEIDNDLSSSEVAGHFDSFRHDISGSVETRTFPLLPWPKAIYLTFGAKYQYSNLNRNMADIYDLFDENFVVPDYYKDVKYDDADKANIKADHDNFNKIRGINKNLTAQESRLYMRANIPGIVQLFRMLSLVDENIVEKGADEPIKIYLEGIVTKDDYIRNVDNGLYPSGWHVWAPWTKNGTGAAVKSNGGDIHKDMLPYNSRGINGSVTYKLRLGHLAGLRSVWKTTNYFEKEGRTKPNKEYSKLRDEGKATNDDGKIMNKKGKLVSEFKPDWGKIIPKFLWLIPGAVLYPLQKLIELVDQGHEADPVRLYMPLEISGGREGYTSQDSNGVASDKEANSFRLGVGIEVNNNFSLMYRYSKSDDRNGYNGYKDETRSIAFMCRF